MPGMATDDLPAPLSRRRRGRVLGGVCAGLAARWDVPVGRVRVAFVLAALVFGLGLLVYLASWLILPPEGEDGVAPGVRGIVLVAQWCGALVALAALAALGAVATVLGLGWIVVALGAAVLAGTLAMWPRAGAGWALLPIGALALPSVALAVGGLRIERQTEPIELAPRTAAQLPAAVHSGLGLLEVDLRHTALPDSGTIALRVNAGVRPTLIALPHDRCVRAQVREHVLPAASRVASAVLGGARSTPGVALFGDPHHELSVSGPAGATRRGPTLRVDFSSAAGRLVVRDYPDGIDPVAQPDWPGYAYDPGPRPRLSGSSKKTRRRVLRSWRDEVRNARKIQGLMRGPCARPRQSAKATRGKGDGGPRGRNRRERRG